MLITGWTADASRAGDVVQTLPADAVRGRQGPAGADQSAAAERTAVFLLRLKPHRHLPRPRGPDGDGEESLTLVSSTFFNDILFFGLLFWLTLP